LLQIGTDFETTKRIVFECLLDKQGAIDSLSFGDTGRGLPLPGIVTKPRKFGVCRSASRVMNLSIAAWGTSVCVIGSPFGTFINDLTIENRV